MIDVRVLIRTGFYSTLVKHGIKSDALALKEVLSSQDQEPRNRQSERVRTVDGSALATSLSQSLW